MQGLKTTTNSLTFAAVAVILMLAGCDADSPTAPASQAQQPANPSPSAAWAITVSASPASFDINEGSGFSSIEVRATRQSNGQRPPTGTTAVLNTTAGVLTSDGGVGTSVPIVFDQTGVARASLQTGVFTSAGTIIVQAQLEGSFGTVNINMVADDTTSGNFGLTDLSPNFGPPSGGTLIEVFGSGFEFPMNASFCEVSLNSVEGADCISLSSVSISSSSRFTAVTPRVDLPAGTNLRLNLVVEKDGGAEVDGLPNAFTYTRNAGGPAQLLLISVSPTSGPNEGGTQVVIRGDGFGPEAQVFFSNGPLIEATVLDITSTRIVAITPSATGPNADNANAIVDIIVRDPNSGQQAILTSAFQYGAGQSGLFISAISRGEGSYKGGDPVTIYGQGFDEPVAVEAGGVGQSVRSVTGTEIVFVTVPVDIACSEQSGNVSVTNIETNERVSGPEFVYFPIEPIPLNLAPASGAAAGGNSVTVVGVGGSFDPPVRVTVGGRPAPVQSVSPDGSTILIQVPEYSDEFPTETCTTGADETGERYASVSVDVLVENLQTSCQATLSLGYTYNPDDTTCRVPAGDGGGGGGGGAGPTASFTTVSAGTMVTFTDTSTAGGAPIVSWDWDFGDGDVSGAQNPVHDFLVAGTYSVMLTVTDGTFQSNSVTVDVTVP